MTDDQLTPSSDATRPEAPQGAPAPTDTPTHDQPTAAGQAPEGGVLDDADDDLLADDETADTLQNDALADEEQP
ncbi:hypothetical protein [Leifsonia sp. NPDC077715]|uniref:hypothetical protein n=1 Tax=Leifsonia sp. NPDC077715 TaxID=3155539 RepID=UPI003429219C